MTYSTQSEHSALYTDIHTLCLSPLLFLYLFSNGLILEIHLSQLLPNTVVNLQKLCHTSVEANGFSLGQVCFNVLWWNTFLLA